MRKVSLFIAMSLDGYIAKPNDDLSFLSLVEKEGEDYGYTTFTKNVDTVIIGRKTFDWVVRELGTAHYDTGERSVYVVTSDKSRVNTEHITFYADGVANLIKELRQVEGNDIYCDGGAEVINELLKHDLIDEMIISIIPVLLGDGTRLFKDGRGEQILELVEAKSFSTGLTQVHYKRKDKK
ncbi:dihydrofolate reductase family protein [Myroides sp.]|uniref:dihydrofolate reductase family protein n=1 Tax=Myroides sp. TaxID=1874736 RepID=UPI003F319F4B